jgi:DNA repair protein RadC
MLPWRPTEAETTGAPRLGKSGSARPSDFELLQDLVRPVLRGKASKVAYALLERFRSLAAVLAATQHELLSVYGVTPPVVTTLQAVYASMTRMLERDVYQRPVLNNLSRLADWLSVRIGHSGQEVFLVLFLDSRQRLIADVEMARGTVDRVNVYPREVIKRALEFHAAGLILVHNHPSGKASPSSADISLTRSIGDSAQIFQIILHDHIIVSNQGWWSMRRDGVGNGAAKVVQHAGRCMEPVAAIEY